MMKIRTLVNSFREGLKGIRRNRMFSLASVGTIAACLFLFGLFFFIVTNVENIMKSAEGGVGITVFFEDGISDAKKKEIGAKIEARKEVREVKYVSADEAWRRYKETSLKPELVETFGNDNPLAGSDSYTVFVKKIENQAEIVNYISFLDGVRKVNSSGSTVSGFTAINSLVGIISVTIIGLLLSVAIFLISTTIAMGISVRKEEIFIMRMVGATDFFISAPFIIEGVIMGVVGAALLVPLALAIGVGIGFVGSFFTVRRHIDV